MRSLKRASQGAVVLCSAFIALIVISFLTSPTRDRDYDPVRSAADFTQNYASIHRGLEISPDFKFLVENLNQFKPKLRLLILNSGASGTGSSRALEVEIAYQACLSSGRDGAEFLIFLSTLAAPPIRLEIVRRLGDSIYGAEPTLREDLLQFFKKLEKENTVEGDFAYSVLASSDSSFAANYSRKNREAKFLSIGLEPFANAEDYPAFEGPTDRQDATDQTPRAQSSSPKGP
jgi:hypothetical protein